MKNLLFIFILLLGTLGVSQAQDYNAAVGLRLGYPVSATYKMFLNESAAVEAYAGFRNRFYYREFSVNAAYLIHNDIDSVDRLKWYYGGGAGLAFYSSRNIFGAPVDGGGISIPISGFIGLEYTLDEAPVSFSADWRPTFYIGGGGSGFGAGYGALAVRYVLN